MFKSLLVVILLGMQLLSGSGVSVFVCIANDSVHFVVAEDDACAPCLPRSGVAVVAHDVQQALSYGRQNGFSVVRSTMESPNLAETRDCTHIPILVASEEVTIVTRAWGAADMEQIAFFETLPSRLGFDGLLQARLASGGAAASPMIPDMTLTIIASVILRC